MHESLNKAHLFSERVKQELDTATKGVFEERFQDIISIANDSTAGQELRIRLKHLHIGWLEASMGGRWDFQQVVADTYDNAVYRYGFETRIPQGMASNLEFGRVAMIHLGTVEEPVLVGLVYQNKNTGKNGVIVTAYKSAWLLGDPNQQPNKLDGKISNIIFGNAAPTLRF